MKLAYSPRLFLGAAPMLLALGLSGSIAAAAGAALPHYTVDAFSDARGAALAFSINESGDVVGTFPPASPGGVRQGFVRINGQLSLMPSLGGADVACNFINDQGDVVGGASTRADGPRHATLWPHGDYAHPVDLHTRLGIGDVPSSALCINQRGDIVGSYGSYPNYTGFLLPGDGGPAVTLPNARLYGVNNANPPQACGIAYPDTNSHIAIFWSAATGVVTIPAGMASAYALNDQGIVCGGKDDVPGTFIWQNGASSIRALPFTGAAEAINNQGVVVGGTADHHAFIWQGSEYSLLNALVPDGGEQLGFANGINEKGQIVVTTGALSTASAVLTPTAAPPPPAQATDLTGSMLAVKRQTKGPKSKRQYVLSGRLTVRNTGTANATASVVAFYLTDPNNLSGGVQVGGSYLTPPLPNTGRNFTTLKYSLALPVGTPLASVQGKVLVAHLDAQHELAESNEENNLVPSPVVR